VLLVDDDTDTLEALAHSLQLEEAHVRTATSAREARDSLSDELPDLIVSDLTMPGETGSDFMKLIRAQGVTVPAIALTGYVRTEDERLAREAGFDESLGKPVQPAKLIKAVARLLQK
jgi:CheY-like chemotaxis protein